jgi:hypothetical protein
MGKIHSKEDLERVVSAVKGWRISIMEAKRVFSAPEHCQKASEWFYGSVLPTTRAEN